MRKMVKWEHIKVMDKLITILTPTYNRASLLMKCYESLINQTSTNFKWVIVDDGSIDSTDKIVKKWNEQAKIEIEYYKKKNGGKHKAINYGVKYINTKLTLILDSDDYLSNDAIEKVENLYIKYKDDETLCGFTFLKKYPNDKYMGDIFPKEGKYNFIKWRVNGIVNGDQCDVVYTKFLKEYPFSEFDNEKYIGESTLWIKLGLKYNMVCKNDAIYIADYLEGGLTKNGRILRLKSPNGSMEYANLCMLKQCSIKRKVKYAPAYIAYGLISNNSMRKLYKNANNKILFFLALPFGKFLEKIWRNKYNL